MRILGIEISRAAPTIKTADTAFAARSIRTAAMATSVPATSASSVYLTASQELSPTLPMQRRGQGQSLPGRSVPSSPNDDWLLAAPDKIPPKQISSILRMAAAGNIWNQYQLSRRMEESWPIFKKCCLEIKLAVASSKYVVHPYCLPGKTPTKISAAKADLVTRALAAGFQPDRFADEDDVNGMIFDLCDAIINGVSMVELLWNEDAVSPQGEAESIVRASAWVHPRNIAVQSDGRLGVANVANSGAMSFANHAADGQVMDNPDKFLVAKFKSKSGSPLTAGLMRSLAEIWVSVVYGREYARMTAQKYGNPFLDIAYDSGITDPGEIDKFERLAQQAAALGYFVHPNNSELKITAAQPMGADNAQMALMKLADEACQLLLLGQTLTTNVGNSGSRALGDVHENVRMERIEEHAKWIARILTNQFADSVLRVNYGRSYLKNPERPTIEADFTRPLSASEQADYLQKVSNSSVPMPAEETYKRAGVTEPQPGDKVLIRGELVIMEEPLTATEKGQKDFDTQLNQQKSVNSEFGDPKGPDHEIEATLAQATEDERRELENLVSAAESATHLNGEAVRVKSRLDEILTKYRT